MNILELFPVQRATGAQRLIRQPWRLVVALLFGTFAATPWGASANLIQDGSFEAQTAAAPFQTIGAGHSFGGWSVTAGSVDLINGYWAAADGNQSVDLSGGSHGTIQQTVALNAGYYTLTFALSGNSDGPPQLKTVLVSLGGASQQFSFTTPPNNNGNMDWVRQTWTVFLPAGGNTVLSFADISGGLSDSTPYGAALDAISLVSTPVPEYGTVLSGLLLLFPLGASALRILHRKNSAAS